MKTVDCLTDNDFTVGACSITKLCLTLCNPWTVAHQAPLSMGSLKQEYWHGLPFPSPGGLPEPGIELVSLTSPALPGTTSEALVII